MTTHDVVTGAMTYRFTYNVNSYYGRLVRVSDVSAGRAVVVRRDYRLHAQHLTTIATPSARRRLVQSQRQLRSHVTTDSNGLLASLTTPSSVTTRLSYVRDTGLLRSRRSAVEARVYQYGGAGRVTTVTYSSGRRCALTSSLDSETNSVHVDSSCDPSTHVQLTQSNHSLHVHCSKTAHATHSIIRLEARLQPNIGFILRRVLAVFTPSRVWL